MLPPPPPFQPHPSLMLTAHLFSRQLRTEKTGVKIPQAPDPQFCRFRFAAHPIKEDRQVSTTSLFFLFRRVGHFFPRHASFGRKNRCEAAVRPRLPMPLLSLFHTHPVEVERQVNTTKKQTNPPFSFFSFRTVPPSCTTTAEATNPRIPPKMTYHVKQHADGTNTSKARPVPSACSNALS